MLKFRGFQCIRSTHPLSSDPGNPMTVEDALNLLLAHPDFPRLTDELGEQGLLQILNDSSKETAHTRLLAWLLDPANSSADGSVLKSFLHFVWSRNPAAEQRVATPLQLEAIPIAQAEAVPEHVIATGGGESYEGRRVDVVVFAEVAGKRRPLLVVEYKVDALEANQQTRDYANWANREWEGASGAGPTLVFISPRSKAQSEQFLSITFAEFADWLYEARFLGGSTLQHSHVVETLEKAVKTQLPFESHTSAAIKETCSDAIDLLNAAIRAGAAKEDPLKGIISRYGRELKALGVALPGRVSQGDSPWVIKVQQELSRTAADFANRWSPTGGGGQLVFWDLAVTRTRKEVWPSARAIWAGLWMGRPTEDGARLEYFFGTDVSELKQSKFAQAQADGLRKWLAQEEGMDVTPGTDGTLVVARHKLTGIPTGDNDTESAAELCWEAQGDNIRRFVSRVETGVANWLQTGALRDALIKAREEVEVSEP